MLSIPMQRMRLVTSSYSRDVGLGTAVLSQAMPRMRLVTSSDSRDVGLGPAVLCQAMPRMTLATNSYCRNVGLDTAQAVLSRAMECMRRLAPAEDEGLLVIRYSSVNYALLRRGDCGTPVGQNLFS